MFVVEDVLQNDKSFVTICLSLKLVPSGKRGRYVIRSFVQLNCVINRDNFYMCAVHFYFLGLRTNLASFLIFHKKIFIFVRSKIYWMSQIQNCPALIFGAGCKLQ